MNLRDPFLTEINEFDPAATAPAEPAPPAAEEPAAPEPAAPEEWSGPQREEYEALVQFAQSASPILQQVAAALEGNYEQPQQQQAPQPPQQQQQAFDPFDPNSVQSFIEAKAQEIVQSQMGDYENVMQLVAAEHGERLARQEMERLHSEMGDFDTDAALMLATGMLGPSSDPQMALANAAKYLHDYEKRIREDERTRASQTTQALHQAPQEAPATTTVNEPRRTPVGPDRYERIVDNWLANRRPQLPVG